MRRSKEIWLWLGGFSLLVTLLFAVGFGYAMKDILFPQPSPLLGDVSEASGNTNDDTLRIVGIGDSLTKGVGDETGKGYIGHLKTLLTPIVGREVNVIGNIAVSGHTTAQLQSEILPQAGVQYTIRQANMIVMTIGGNDLFRVGQDEVDTALVEQRIPETLTRLADILKSINEWNPQAEVYYIGLYNPFADLENGVQSSLVVQKWNSEVFALLKQYPQMTFVPSYDLFSKNLDAYLSSDHFHPNQPGYERMARRIAQIIE
jgi:lysophospholipase L1-like esterase